MPGKILVDITPLRESRDFRLLFTGQLISMLGTQLTVVAIPYQVYRLTHSTLQVGAISLAQLFPFLVGALLAGPLGDSSDRRRIMIWTAGASALTSAAMAFNAGLTHPSLVLLYVVSALAAGFTGFSSTARMASVPGLVQRRHLSAAAALMQIIFQVGTVVGPAVSGLLLGIGLRLVYGIDAVTFVVALIATMLMVPIPPAEGPHLKVWASTKEGLRYLKSRQALQGVYIIDINAMVFGMPRALFPAMAGAVFGGGTITLGFLYAAPGVGALIGAVTTGWVTHIKRQGRAVILAVLAWGVAITVFGLVHTVWLALLMLAIAGWSDVISAVLRNTILQTTIPERFRSRMSSIQMAVVQGGPRLGDMESGAVAAATSIEFSVVSGGLACLAGAIAIGLLMPHFRHHVADEIDEVPV
ncbi:MAG TPA: MFS transporter [Acidimicrobiales bacterium]|jgi:MFS family permease|nr:MFS transporter [Acidimicrobiales bacterium]